MKRQLSEVRDQMLNERYEQRLSTMAQVAEQCVGIVTAEDAQAFFRHLQRYLPPCLTQEDIFM